MENSGENTGKTVFSGQQLQNSMLEARGYVEAGERWIEQKFGITSLSQIEDPAVREQVKALLERWAMRLSQYEQAVLDSSKLSVFET